MQRRAGMSRQVDCQAIKLSGHHLSGTPLASLRFTRQNADLIIPRQKVQSSSGAIRAKEFLNQPQHT